MSRKHSWRTGRVQVRVLLTPTQLLSHNSVTQFCHTLSWGGAVLFCQEWFLFYKPVTQFSSHKYVTQICHTILSHMDLGRGCGAGPEKFSRYCVAHKSPQQSFGSQKRVVGIGPRLGRTSSEVSLKLCPGELPRGQGFTGRLKFHSETTCPPETACSLLLDLSESTRGNSSTKANLSSSGPSGVL